MRNILTLRREEIQSVRYILSDIDDTITTEGRLSAQAYLMIEKLSKAGIYFIPVTGRPAGWCDHIARMWPVHGVVGENGAFYFVYNREQKRMSKRFLKSREARQRDRARLDAIKREILVKYPHAGVASDQQYREEDLAIDFCEDVAPLCHEEVAEITHIFRHHGASVKISSIHINAWFGNHDKLTTTKLYFSEMFQIMDLEDIQDQVIFLGDSPNDGPMFAFFSKSVGMANIKNFPEMREQPKFVTNKVSGDGFIEFAELFLALVS